MQIQASTPEAYKLFHQGALALADIEKNGIKVDAEKLDKSINKIRRSIKKRIVELKNSETYKIWKREFGLKTKLGSTQQLAKILYDKMGVECKVFTPKGNPSTSEEALQDIDHPFVKQLFKVKHLEKTVGTFLKGIQREVVNGFLHPFFHLHTVSSMRGSSSEPNFQNLPKHDEFIAKLVRSVIIPRSGRHFWEIDFKGAEVCVSAAVTGDRALYKYLTERDENGKLKNDMHRDTAADLFLLPIKDVTSELRYLTKNCFTFAEFYGSYYKQTGKSLWEEICRQKNLFLKGTNIHVKQHLASKGIKKPGNFEHDAETIKGTFEDHVKEVERIFWHERFVDYTKWKKEWYEKYKKECGFRTVTGFYISGLMSRNAVLNYPIQGPSFHCLLWFLIKMNKWLKKNKMKTLLVGQIHDSAEGDSPPDEIQDVLGKATELISCDLQKEFTWITVPMSVEVEVADVDCSWYDKKPWVCESGVWQPEKKAA